MAHHRRLLCCRRIRAAREHRAPALMLPDPAGAILGCGINPACIVGKAVGGGISSVAGDAITALAKAVLGALGHAIEWASTLWVGVGTPSVTDSAGQSTGTVSFLQHNLLYYTTGLAVLSTLDRRRRGSSTTSTRPPSCGSWSGFWPPTRWCPPAPRPPRAS